MTDEFRLRLQQTLVREKDRGSVFLKEGDQIFTCADVLRLMVPLQATIEEFSKPWDQIPVQVPKSAAQVIALLAVLNANRIPLVMSETIRQTKAPSRPLSYRLAIRPHPGVIPTPVNGAQEYPAAPATLYLSPTAQPTLMRQSPLADENPSEKHEQAPTLDARTALILMSSGSTGEPKGICVPSAGLLVTIDDLITRFGLNEQTIAPILLPTCHSMGLNTQLLPTLLAGGRCVFSGGDRRAASPFRTILREQGTFVALVADLVRLLWDERHNLGLPAAEHVKHVQLAGGYIHESHIMMTRELFPRALIHKGYGLTEAIRVSMKAFSPGETPTDSVGKPLPFVDVQIRDSAGTRLPPGEVGEIHVRGPNVLVARADAPDAKCTDPLGYFATGDLGILNSNGELTIKGRSDSLFKLSGLKVFGTEIERSVLQSVPEARAAKCIAVFDEKLKRQRLLLFLELAPQETSNETASNADNTDQDENGASETAFTDTAILEQLLLRLRWAAKQLDYFPRDVVVLDKIPRTYNGKIAIHELEVQWAKLNQPTVSQPFLSKTSSVRIHSFHRTDTRVEESAQ